MLVPPSLDEWLPENHLSRFIAEIVETSLDLDRFYSSYRKVKGQPPYDPRLMVRVLLYGYCVGVRSSRELERVSFPSNRGGFFNDGWVCWSQARVGSRRCLR